MRKFVICLVMLLLVSSPASAEFHGRIWGKAELYNDCPGQEWGIDLSYNIWPKVAVGAELVCLTSEFDKIGFVPYQQNYEVYLRFDPFCNTTIKLSQWCDHPVINAQYETYYIVKDKIPTGIYLLAEMHF